MITSIRSLANERARRRESRIRQHEAERDAREAAIFQRTPRLAEIKALQAEIGLDLARLVLRAPTRSGKNFADLKAWALQLGNEWTTLLHRHHIDPREFEVQWDCADCQDTGWLAPEQAGPDAVHPPQKCHCLVQEEVADLYRASGLTGQFREQRFDTFDLTVYPPSERAYMGHVNEACRTFSEQVRHGKEVESILLMGDVGLGKTFLCSAIGNAVLDARRSMVYFTLSEFLDLVRLMKFDDDQDYRQGVQRLLDADLIILDDLGAEKVTEFAAQELFNIINHRMNRLLPMVIATNLTPGEIQSTYGQRIASRLLGSFEVLPLKGEDVRRVLRQRRAHA